MFGSGHGGAVQLGHQNILTFKTLRSCGGSGVAENGFKLRFLVFYAAIFSVLPILFLKTVLELYTHKD